MYTLTGTGISAFQLASNITVANDFTLIGNNVSNQRVIIKSNIDNTQRTITCNGTVSSTNGDFMDIVGAGTATWDLSAATGGSGDCGGNTGITFTAPTTVTATGTSGFSWSSHSWSGRAYPLAQDSVSIPNAFSASQTITMDCVRLGGNIIFSCTGSPTLVSSGGFMSFVQLYGSADFSGIGSIGSWLTLYLRGRGSYTISSSVILKNIVIEAYTGTYTANSNIDFTGFSLSLTAGTFDANGYEFTANSFASNGTSVRSLISGSGTWNIVGNNTTVWNITISANYSHIQTNPINFTYSGSTGARSINSGTTTYPLSFNITAGSDTVNISNNVKDLDFTGFTGTIAGTSFNLYGDIIFNNSITYPNTASTIINLSSTTTQTITSNGSVLTFSVNKNASGTLNFSDDFTTTRNFTQNGGTVDISGKIITIGTTYEGQNAVGNTLMDSAGGGVLNLTGNTADVFVFQGNSANFTIDNSTDWIIKLNAITSNRRYFSMGSNKLYPTIKIESNTGGGRVDFVNGNNNTFKGLEIDNTGGSFTIYFTNSNYVFVPKNGYESPIKINGGTYPITFDSTNTGVFTFYCSKNFVVLDNTILKYCACTGGARFFATYSGANGNTSNKYWRFTSASNRSNAAGSGILIV